MNDIKAWDGEKFIKPKFKAMFTHYLLTRYNLGLYGTNPYKIKNPADWMAHRLELFEETAKSVAKQSEKNFEWLIFVDRDTPARDIERICKVLEKVVKAGVKGARVVGGPNMPTPPKDNIKPWLITTRFDCDDRIESGFIAAIQGEFDQKQEVIDTYGLQLCLETRKMCKTNRKKPNSPFISLIEKVEGCKTVFIETHSTMYAKYSGRFVSNPEPLYLQVIHDRNLMNKLTGDWV